MLVVISDLHFQDTRNDTIQDINGRLVNVDRNVSADAFYMVFEELFSVAEAKKAKELIVVLAGDIFDLNRSSRWQLTGYRPYGDKASPPEKWGPVALDILADIIKSNQETFDVFKSLISPQSWIASALNKPSIPFEFMYIPGNHDRIVNLYPPLYQTVGKIFDLDGSTKFVHEVCRDDYGVHIRHGHEYDRHNFAGWIPPAGPFKVNERDYDMAPLGDFVTIEIAAGLAYEYRTTYEDAIKAGDKTHQDIYCKLLEFDDLRPQSDIMDFVGDAWGSLAPVADKVIRRSLESKFLRDQLGICGKILPVLKVLPTKCMPTRFIIRLISGMKSQGPDAWEYAKREPSLDLYSNDSKCLYAVSGHTHCPNVEFLRNQNADQGGKEYFFFDTGTWRQQIRKCRDERSFSKAKALTYVVFYRPDENISKNTIGTKHSFDYWSGFTKKAVI